MFFLNSFCFLSAFVLMTDALPAVRYRDANMGIFSTVCHQIVRLPVVTCSSCLFARPCSTDKQGNSFKPAVLSVIVVAAHDFQLSYCIFSFFVSLFTTLL